MTIQRTYRIKLNPSQQVQAALQHFEVLVQQASQRLLRRLWTENWLDTLASSKKKAYKVIDEAQVTLQLEGQDLYLPSRIRRGMAERVGQILRSQSKRKDCFYDCLQVTKNLGLEGNLDTLVRQVAKTLQVFHGKYYRYALIRQTLRFLRRLHLKHSLDVWLIRYTDVVHPTVQSFIFPYSPDDGQALKYHSDGKTIDYQIKLPSVPLPLKSSHWEWFHASQLLPDRIQEKIQNSKSVQPLKPLLKTQILKGGLIVPILQFPWEFPTSPQDSSTHQIKNQRTLCVDLGLINLATSVICEAGWQISAPSFIKLNGKRYRDIERLYENIAGLKSKLKRFPAKWTGQGKRAEEQEKLYRKLDHFREELAHAVSNELVTIAQHMKCPVMILEDLRSLEPPKGKKQLSRRLSNWLRGRIPEILEYKCRQTGILLLKVNPWGTSSYYPRCGNKGQKVKAPNDLTADSKGRYFHCSFCGFTGDRDYTAALNLYRVAHLNRKTKETLPTTSPILYQRIGTPANRPVGGTVIRKLTHSLRVTAG